MLVCWWWWFDWSFARLIVPVVTANSIVLSSNEIQNRDTLVRTYLGCLGKWLLELYSSIERDGAADGICCWDMCCNCFCWLWLCVMKCGPAFSYHCSSCRWRTCVNAAVFVKLQSINVPWRSQLLEWTSLVLSFDCLLLMKFQFFLSEILRLWLDVRSFLWLWCCCSHFCDLWEPVANICTGRKWLLKHAMCMFLVFVCGSVVKATDLCPVSLGLSPTGTHMSHCWQNSPCAGYRVVRIDPLCFVAWCRKKRLNQALSVILLV